MPPGLPDALLAHVIPGPANEITVHTKLKFYNLCENKTELIFTLT